MEDILSAFTVKTQFYKIHFTTMINSNTWCSTEALIMHADTINTNATVIKTQTTGKVVVTTPKFDQFKQMNVNITFYNKTPTRYDL